MADNATNLPIGSAPLPPQGSGDNFFQIGEEKEFSGHKVRVNKTLIINNEEFPVTLAARYIPLQSGEDVILKGKGLEMYDRVGFTLVKGGGSFVTAPKNPGQGDSLFTFKVPESIAGQVKDGGQFWLKLLSRAFPSANATMGPHALYFLEQPKDEQGRTSSGSAGGGRAAAARLAMQAMGGIVGAGVGALSSTTGVSSAGAKTISQSGTVGATNVKEVSSVESADEDVGYGQEIQQEVQETGGGEATSTSSATSTSEISTGGGTVSESGTISAGGQTIREESTGVTQTVSSGGTVESAGSAGVSGQVTSTIGGQIAGSGASGSVGVQREVSSTVQGGGGIMAGSVLAGGGGGGVRTEIHGGGGGVSGTANIGGRVISSGQTNVGGTLTGQMTGTGTQGTGVKGNVEVEGSVKGNLEAEVEAGVQGNQVPTSGKPAQATTSTAAPAVPSPSSGKGSAAPAGFGRMMANKEEMASAGGTAEPPAAGKPGEQGGAGAPSAPKKENEPANAAAGEPPKEPGQTKPTEPPASPEAGEGKGLPAEEPGAEGKPADEAKSKAKPASEPPEPGEKTPASGLPPALPEHGRPKPEDNIAVPPPLRPDRRTSEGSGGSVDNKDKPIDAANGALNKDFQPPAGPPSGGGGEPPSAPPQAERPQPFGPSGGGPVRPASARNREPRNVFQEPRSGGDMLGEALGGKVNPNPAAYPTVRRLLDKKLDLAGKGIGTASSKIWYYGFGSSCATFFTGLDFMLGAVVMDAYWIFGHRKDPKLFPLKLWQKAVTIAANVIPPVLITLILALIMVAGCNWPSTNSDFNKKTSYRATVVGAFIGDSCKYFDISNITSSAGNTTSATPAASAQTGSQTTQTTTGPVTPLGPSPSTGVTTPPTNPVASTAGILSFIKSWNGPEVYPAVDWGNSDPNIDPAIKANLNELQGDFSSLNNAWQQAGHAALQPKQVYRPEAYQEHYRSIWEIFAVINSKDDTQGYLCDQTSHLDSTAVSQAYAQASASDKQTLQSLFAQHEISLYSTPAGCVSDHASGIAMDIEDQNAAVFNRSLYPTLISTAQNYGMCHNIAGDQPHFSLADKLPVGTNCSQP